MLFVAQGCWTLTIVSDLAILIHNKCLPTSNKKLVVTGATLVVTGALLVVTRLATSNKIQVVSF